MSGELHSSPPARNYPSPRSKVRRLPASADMKMTLSPAPAGTGCLLAAIALAYVLYPAESTAAGMATVAAIPVGIGFLASLIFDLQKAGLRNLLRTDLLCLVGIYALTLAEFLFPQPEFEFLTTPEETALGLNIALLGIASLAVGRHIVPPKRIKTKWLTLNDLSNNALFQVLFVCAFIGFLNILLSVDFQIFGQGGALYHMSGPRFSQPWTRGRIGGINSLLTELALLIYVVPPLTGVIINRRKTFPPALFFIVLLIFSFTLFYGFSGGTRNVFVAYWSTFLMGYLLTLKKNTWVNTIGPILFSVWLIGFASYHMLEFRTIGLRNYIEYQVYASENTRSTLAVDYNLASIGAVANNMPEPYPFLGREIIVWSIVRPIPRVLWQGKPEGISISAEELAGAQGWTVAVTYLGEAYMMAGFGGVVGVSLCLGALAAWWNRMAIAPQTDYGLVVYALGFFAAGLTMRSMFWLTTAILPVIALIAFRKYGPFK